MTTPADADTGRAKPALLGPSSLTWRLFGDHRIALMPFWLATLQNMHPVIGIALVQHSDVFDNEFARLVRSAGPISDAVYDLSGQAAQRVRSFHNGIEGQFPDGQSYHALSPDAYYWAHATFFYVQIVVAERFGTPLTCAEKETLFQESVEWYGLYGLSQRALPATFAEFERYWKHMIEEVLTVTEATVRVPVMNGLGNPRPSTGIARNAWSLQEALLLPFLAWIARGTLPEVIRARNGWRWTWRDELGLRLASFTVRTVFRILPPAKRLNGHARHAFKTAGVRP